MYLPIELSIQLFRGVEKSNRLKTSRYRYIDDYTYVCLHLIFLLSTCQCTTGFPETSNTTIGKQARRDQYSHCGLRVEFL
jgi:hypothetical protein